MSGLWIFITFLIFWMAHCGCRVCVNSVKILGVTLYDALNWSDQAITTARSVNFKLFQPKLCKNLLPAATRLYFISKLILPTIYYCCVLFNGISAEHNWFIQVDLNSCVRYIFNVSRFEYITSYYEKLKWLKVQPRWKLFTLSTCITM